MFTPQESIEDEYEELLREITQAQETLSKIVRAITSRSGMELLRSVADKKENGRLRAIAAHLRLHVPFCVGCRKLVNGLDVFDGLR